MNIYQIRYFCEACRCQNITKAAENLHISQPAITNAIKDLEAEFGVQLFHRLAKGVILTEEGKVLYNKSNVLISYMENLIEVMGGLGHKRRRIRLGIPPMTSATIYPRIYNEFYKLHPDVDFSTKEYGSAHLLELLHEDAIDMTFMPLDMFVPLDLLEGNHYHVVPLKRIETVLCVHKSHRFADYDSIDVEEVGNEPLILYNMGQKRVVEAHFSIQGVIPNIVHYTAQYYTIREFLKYGNICAFMFRDLVANEPEFVGISFKPPITVVIGLVWKSDTYITDAMQQFIQYIKNTMPPEL